MPTIGRPALLASLLESLAAGTAHPAEVLVVDQSADDATAALLQGSTGLDVRRITSAPPGIARAMNAGLRASAHDACLITNDDITVAHTWVERCHRYLGDDARSLVTGRVLAAGDDPRRVPSTMTAEIAVDYVRRQPWGLFPGNCAGDRREILALGGFDERPTLALAAEDNDLAWRWLSSGRTIRYRPDLTVWHHDWRAPDAIAARFRQYGEGQGALYAKHLWSGELAILPHVGRDLAIGLRGQAARWIRHRAPSTDWRQGLVPGLLVGFGRETASRLRRPPSDLTEPAE